METTVGEQIGAAVHRNRGLSREGLLERGFSRMFQGLVYAQIWEDPVADMAALGLGPTDHVVSIASGGCNVMSYLTAGPAAITAVDLSPAHVALLRLKLAAARHLPDHAAFEAFFGRADDPENPVRYWRYIAPQLDAESRAYWEARGPVRPRISAFARGFYRHGALGRFIGAAHLVARLGGVDFTRLLDAETLADQRRFFDEELDPLIGSWPVRALAARRASLFGLGIPPAQYEKLAADGGGSILPVLRERVRRLVCDFPIRDNYFTAQAFGRGYDRRPGAARPPYLEAGNFEAVLTGAPRRSRPARYRDSARTARNRSIAAPSGGSTMW